MFTQYGDTVRVNSKGQVTIPAELRARHGIREGDEVQVVDDDGRLWIVREPVSSTHGDRAVQRLRGRATTRLSTEALLDMLRGE